MRSYRTGNLRAGFHSETAWGGILALPPSHMMFHKLLVCASFLLCRK